MIPKAVYREISAKEESVCKSEVDKASDWLHVKSIKNEMAKSMFIHNNIYIKDSLIKMCLEQVGEVGCKQKFKTRPS